MSPFKYKQVIVVRDDLNMSKGKMAAQVAHASVEASEKARGKKKEWWKAWKREGQCKVVVKVDCEEELSSLEGKAMSLGLPTALITDRGVTELPPNTTTCLGIGPGPAEIVDKVTGKLPLV